MNRWFGLKQLWQLTIALFREIIREPGVLFWGILFPILMSLGLGLAFTKKTDVIRKVAIITKDERSENPSDKSVLTSLLQGSCEKNSSGNKDSWIWRYTIKDEKLGNSIFLIYEL